MKRFLLVTMALLSSFTSFLSPLFAKQTREVHLRWIHTSDVHGALFGYDFLRQNPTTGGLSSIYAIVKQQRDEMGDRLIFTDGGDCLQGQPTAYYYNFVDTISPHLVAEVMNSMGYVCGAVGNHDIETGHEVYDRWISQCHFPILGANVIDVKTGKPYLKPYTIIEREGVRIAILGMLTPAIPNWLPERMWEGLCFEEMVTSARKWMKVIQKQEKPDLIVGLFHSGYDGGIVTPEYRENAVRQVAEQVPGFDLICYGHDHQAATHYMKNRDGGPVLVMAPTSDGKRVAIADIELSIRKGRVVGKKISANVPFVANESPALVKEFEQRFAIQRDTITKWVNQPIGTLASPLWEREAFFGPSEFIDLIHQMQLDLTGADVSFVAPLSFDSRLHKGTIRVSDMFALYKYENLLYTMRMTGREIKNFLEMSYGMWTNQMRGPDDHILLLDNNLDNGRRNGLKNFSFNMDSAAGIIYTVDVSKPEGERINIQSMADGSPFDLNREYKVAVNSYRGNGGGELMTRGAGIPHEELANRMITSTDKDLRYYLMQRIIEQKTVVPRCLHQWRFIPEEWAQPAIARDRLILFPNSHPQ